MDPRERSSPLSLEFTAHPVRSSPVPGRRRWISVRRQAPPSSSLLPRQVSFSGQLQLTPPSPSKVAHHASPSPARLNDAPAESTSISGRSRPASGEPPPLSASQEVPPQLPFRPPREPTPPSSSKQGCKLQGSSDPPADLCCSNGAQGSDPHPPCISSNVAKILAHKIFPSSSLPPPYNPSLGGIFRRILRTYFQSSAYSSLSPGVRRRWFTSLPLQKATSLNLPHWYSEDDELMELASKAAELLKGKDAIAFFSLHDSLPDFIPTTSLFTEISPFTGHTSSPPSPSHRPACQTPIQISKPANPALPLPSGSSVAAVQLPSSSPDFTLPQNQPISFPVSHTLPLQSPTLQVHPRTETHQPPLCPSPFKNSNSTTPNPAQSLSPTPQPNRGRRRIPPPHGGKGILPIPTSRHPLIQSQPPSPLFFPTSAIDPHSGTPLHCRIPPAHSGQGILPSPPLFLPSTVSFPCPIYTPISPQSYSPYLWLVPVFPLVRLVDHVGPPTTRRRRRRGRRRPDKSIPPPTTTVSASPPSPPPVPTSSALSPSTISTPLPSTDSISSPSVASVATSQTSPETARPPTSGSRPSAQTSSAARPPSAGSRPTFSEVVSRRIVADLVASAPRRLGTAPSRHTPPQTRSRSRLC